MLMHISKKLVLRAVILSVLAPLFFGVSLLLVSSYIGGDQEWYRSFYEALGGAPLYEVPLIQGIHTGSAEPMFGVVMWTGAAIGIDKDIYISAWNTVFMVAIFNCCVFRNRCGMLFLLLLLSNFYLLVLLTGAERLKFSYLALVIAVGSSSRATTYIATAISPLLHFQSILIVSCRCFGYLGSIRLRKSVKKKTFYQALFLAPLAVVGGALFAGKFMASLAGKYSAYSEGGGGLAGAANILLIIFISLIVLPRKAEAVLSFAACAAVAIILGPERVNMIAVSLFIWYVIRDQKTRHPAVLILMAYFSAKSIWFVQNIINFGNGFAVS